jgi:hypothetical protein
MRLDHILVALESKMKFVKSAWILQGISFFVLFYIIPGPEWVVPIEK